MAKGQKRFKTPRRVGRQCSTDSNGETGQDQTLTRLTTSQHNKESSSVLTENHCGIFDKTFQDVDRSSHATGVDVNSKLKCFGQRKRKIHVDVVECANFSESKTGSKALTHPHQIKKSSKDRNRGLQPRSRIKRLKSTQSCSSSNVYDPQTGTDAHSSTNTFTTATSLELLIQTPTKLHDLSQSSSRVQKQKRNHRGKRFMPQKNTLLKYFAIKKTEGPSCTISDTDSADDHDVSGKNLKDFTSPNKTWNTSKMYSPITKITDVIYKSDLLPDLSRSSRLKRSDVHCNKSLFAGREDGQFKHSGGEYSSTAYTSCESNHSKSFGLLGDALVICNCVDNASCPTASSSLTDTTLFEHLPAEVVEHIFCQLPILDLCLNCNRVCTQWNEKISHPKVVD